MSDFLTSFLPRLVLQNDMDLSLVRFKGDYWPAEQQLCSITIPFPDRRVGRRDITKRDPARPEKPPIAFRRNEI